MRKNLFLKDVKAMLKLWVMFALFLSFVWTNSAYSWGAPSPRRHTSVSLAPMNPPPSIVNNTEFIPPIVTEQSDAISKALISSFSLENAGVKSLTFRILEGAIPPVRFEENQMNQTAETLIFRQGQPILEMDAGDHINSDNVTMPYCLLRLRKQDRSIPDSKLKLGQAPLSSDIWLPSPIRFQVNEDSVRLSLKFVEVQDSRPSLSVIKVEELECHFLNKNLLKANIYDVLRGVLGEHVEIAFSME